MCDWKRTICKEGLREISTRKKKKMVREKGPVNGVACGVNVSGSREGKLTSCARGT